MKKTIYKYFFYEFLRYFTVTLFAFAAVIWTIQAVNFLDLVTDDGHAFRTYFFYSFLTTPKILTKLIPLSFLIASILTILKLEKDNELIILWTSGLNKIYIVNLFFCMSLIIMMLQILMTTIITPNSLNHSRSLLKEAKLQFIPSLLKEKQFNDTVKGLTVFVDKKNENGIYENIFIRDDGKVLSQISSSSSTIFAKSGYVTQDEKNLVLMNGNIQKQDPGNAVKIIKFDKTILNLSELTTKSTKETKIQETPTLSIINCMLNNYQGVARNCNQSEKSIRDTKIEINKRFGMPIFVPLISLITCFLFVSRKEEKFSGLDRWVYGLIGALILIISEISVKYSGNSINHTLIYYLIPLILLPLIYLILIKTFKYENLRK